MSSQPSLIPARNGLAPGTRLGAFEVHHRLGAGGMGEVYQARDARLGRDVAIKVLPAELTDNPEYLARFEREARLVASLNHPNIAALYGVDDSEGVPYLVLELVPGRTLSELLAEGPLPVETALDVCRQVADALEAAHARAIVHRDLKPSNVRVTPAGQVKVLDFGLAKGPAAEHAAPDISGASTVTFGGAHDSGRGRPRGPLMGTLAYMSPEGVRGGPADRLMDVWSFGCLLYEVLTGRRAFEGPTSSDTIAAILERDPDWSALPNETPPRVRDLLRRCLRRDRRRRLHDVADARIEIEEALLELGAGSGPAPLWRRLARGVVARPGVALVGVGLVAGLALAPLLPRQTPAAPVYRLFINLPVAAPLALDRQPALAVAPDGRSLAYVARRGSRTQLYLRRLGQFDAAPIPGTEGGDGPVFSPDGAWLAFTAEGKLKKIPVAGGEALIVADAPTPHGVAWGPGGVLYFAPSSVGGIHRVAADGGSPETLTSPDSRNGESAHRWPEVLPGGRAVVYTVHRTGSESVDDARLAVRSLQTGESRILVEGGTFPRYVPTGHLVYARSGMLFAVKFDAVRLEVTGPPVPVAEEVSLSPLSGAAQFAFSADGLLAYAPGGAQTVARTLLWVGRDGATRPATETRRAFFGPRLSPDRRRLALTVEDEKGFDVWIQDLDRDTLTRLTSEAGHERLPVWSPDGRRLAFGSSAVGRPPSLFWKTADGSDETRVLSALGRRPIPASVAPDGSVLAFTDQDPTPGGTGNDVWLLPLPRGKPQPFLKTPFDEAGPVFSPDGRWIAYTSNETGREEVYVRPYPGPGGKWQISTEGGSEPMWSPEGRELFFRHGDKVLAVSLARAGRGLRASRPALLFEAPYDRGFPWYANYDVSAAGDQLLMIRSEPRPAPTQINVVIGWFAALERDRPAGSASR